MGLPHEAVVATPQPLEDYLTQETLRRQREEAAALLAPLIATARETEAAERQPAVTAVWRGWSRTVIALSSSLRIGDAFGAEPQSLGMVIPVSMNRNDREFRFSTILGLSFPEDAEEELRTAYQDLSGPRSESREAFAERLGVLEQARIRENKWHGQQAGYDDAIISSAARQRWEQLLPAPAPTKVHFALLPIITAKQRLAGEQRVPILEGDVQPAAVTSYDMLDYPREIVAALERQGPERLRALLASDKTDGVLSMAESKLAVERVKIDESLGAARTVLRLVRDSELYQAARAADSVASTR